MINEYPYYSTVNDIRMQFIEWFSKYGLEGPKGKIGADWPHFKSLPLVHNKENLLHVIPGFKKNGVPLGPVWVVVEDENSILGKQVGMTWNF